MSRVPPHATDVERIVLGSMMLNAGTREDGLGLLRTEDFYDPVLADVFRAIGVNVRRGTACTPRLLVATLRPMGRDVSEQTLVEIEHAGTLVGFRGYARIVADAATRRRLISTASGLVDAAYDESTDLGEVLDVAGTMRETIDAPPLGGSESPSLDDVLDAPVPETPWAIVGTLRKRERLVVIAEPGGGKSTLLRQWGIMLAQGLHPFRFHPVVPLRVLVVDLENEREGSREELGPMRDEARRRLGPAYSSAGIRFEFRPEGIDVTRRADAVWLMERVAANAPDVVVVGPTYKIHETDDNDAAEVRRVQRVLDLVRMRYDVALLIEAHAPKESFKRGGRLTVAGSRLWTQWPEFVYGLVPVEDGRAARWQQVRPPRYRRRDWPEMLRRDAGGFPWAAYEML